jgi:hypothetical protein
VVSLYKKKQKKTALYHVYLSLKWHRSQLVSCMAILSAPSKTNDLPMFRLDAQVNSSSTGQKSMTRASDSNRNFSKFTRLNLVVSIQYKIDRLCSYNGDDIFQAQD